MKFFHLGKRHMRKIPGANTSIPIAPDVLLLRSAHLVHSHPVLISYQPIAQWIQKSNDFPLKFIDVFGSPITDINVAILILPVFQMTQLKWFCFGGNLFQQLYNLGHALQRKFGHVKRNVWKMILAIQNKEAALFLQPFAETDCLFRNFLRRINNNVKRFRFLRHVVKTSSPT